MRKIKIPIILLLLLLTSCKGYQEDVRSVAVNLVKKPKISEPIKLKPITANRKVEKLISFGDNVGTFDFNKASLRNSTVTQDKIKTSVIEKVKGRSGQLWVIGHTDNTGPTRYNYKLSLKRASEVSKVIKSLLLGDNNIVVRELGKGEGEPMFPNNNVLNRRKNRRVEVFFIETIKN